MRAKGPFTITDEYDGTCVKVEDHRCPFFTVISSMAHVFEYRPGELLLEVPLLDILDDIPRHMEMAGHIKDGHMFREFKDVPLEGSGIEKRESVKPRST
ncbi:MAG: hypothetical protein A4E57_04483 [Syntrophorhabdaceae bacterium PtaU1.Bin034]|nr:MAG: hypothetical protein A4E57_04483 [Syntrophorhabdaceae bacterium PtaU1.Bin034]